MDTIALVDGIASILVSSSWVNGDEQVHKEANDIVEEPEVAENVDIVPSIHEISQLTSV